ncbi:MAG: cytochrome c-type biogenesis protein CcmH [Rhodospirillaceae bacterium]|nr:cytochrome c-type biogenesis protein CcmH [Rhodospirillaceae bacterium]
MRIFVLLFALFFAGAVHAVEPSEMLKDPVLEARAREVSKHLRCVVCQNETIDESNADIAKDMRLLLRTRILAGDSNDQVIQFLVSRYGDYVLLKPRFMASTYLLWFGPFIVLLLGAFVVYRRLKGTPVAGPAPLSPEEKAALEELAPGERTP